MHINTTHQMVQQDCYDLKFIYNTCRQQSAFIPSLPADEEKCITCIAYSDEKEPLAALNAVYISDNCWELNGYTVPGARQKGYFRSLLAHMQKILLKQSPAPLNLIFPCYDGQPEAIACLEAIGAEETDGEYLLKQDIDYALSLQETGNKIDLVPTSDNYQLSRFHSQAFKLSQRQARLAIEGIRSNESVSSFLGVKKVDHTPVGSFHLSQYEDNFYLLGFLVLPIFRKQGIGAQMIDQILKLPMLQGKSLFLQVSASNPVAFHLYRKKDFTVHTHIRYFTLPLHYTT